MCLCLVKDSVFLGALCFNILQDLITLVNSACTCVTFNQVTLFYDARSLDLRMNYSEYNGGICFEIQPNGNLACITEKIGFCSRYHCIRWLERASTVIQLFGWVNAVVLGRHAVVCSDEPPEWSKDCEWFTDDQTAWQAVHQWVPHLVWGHTCPLKKKNKKKKRRNLPANKVSQSSRLLQRWIPGTSVALINHSIWVFAHSFGWKCFIITCLGFQLPSPAFKFCLLNGTGGMVTNCHERAESMQM